MQQIVIASSWGLRQYARGIFALIALLAIGCILQDSFELEQAGAASSELQDIIPQLLVLKEQSISTESTFRLKAPTVGAARRATFPRRHGV